MNNPSCCYCGCSDTPDAFRPYGPNGAPICYDCAQRPEYAAGCEAEFTRQLEAARDAVRPGQVVVMGQAVGPYPTNAENVPGLLIQQIRGTTQ